MKKQALRNVKITCALVLFSIKLWAQQCPSVILIDNPSFEGTPGMSVAPNGWIMCSSCDILPGPYGINLPPSDGQSYVGGGSSINPYSTEDIGQQLSSPLLALINYSFSVDLANANFSPPTGLCGEIQLWGSNNSCGKDELLWSSGNLTNTNWQTFQVSFTPTATYNYILFNASHNNLCFSSIYLLIDNMSNIQPDVAVAIGGNISCNGLFDGWAKVGYKPGPPPYTYLWNNGATVDSIGGLCPGTYRVDVTNGVGFTSCDTIVITEPLVLQANPING